MDLGFLPPDATRYLDGLLARHPPAMEAVLREVHAEGQPAVHTHTGALLRVLVAASGGRRILEVGTNLGYGAMWLAMGLSPGGHVDTIELDPRMAARARAHVHAAGLEDRITVHEGAALDVMPHLPEGAYDLVFLDAVKSEYLAYLEEAMRLVRPGGLVAADNLLWGGDVWEEEADDEDTRALREYARVILTHPRLCSTVVPTGDGLGVSVVMGKP